MTRETPYARLGGEAALRRLVERFYALMDDGPEFAGIRALHPADLRGAREKLYMFLSGWLGGPSLYTERYGQPMLRARHLPFAIGREERDAWIACMSRALGEVLPESEAPFRAALVQKLSGTADWMRNRPDDGPGSA